jgi:hypothetical protein
LQTNEELEQELVKPVGDSKQTTIIDDPVDQIEIMYEKLNKKIAYNGKDHKSA